MKFTYLNLKNQVEQTVSLFKGKEMNEQKIEKTVKNKIELEVF